MHGEERDVEPDEHEPEVQLAELLAHQPAGDLGEPVVEPGEQAEQSATEQHVVEVGDDVVGVVLLVVGRHQGVGHAGEASDHEHRHHADGKEQGCSEPDRAAPQGGRPVEDLHAGGHRDEHRRHRERRVGVRAEADGEHVVRPHAPPHEADEDAREDHRGVAEEGLAAEDRKDLRDDAHGGQDQDVHLRMAEQPEQVLPEERVASGHRVVEGRVPQPVERELEQGDRDDRHGEEQEERGHQGHPHEDGHAHEGHPRRAEVEDGRDEVGGGGDRGDTQHLEAEGVERQTVPR